MENGQNKSFEEGKDELRKKSIFTTSSMFNPDAKPFLPSKFFQSLASGDSQELINVGPSQVPVNAKIWKTIASNRTLPELPVLNMNIPNGNQFPLPSTSNGPYSGPFNEYFETTGYFGAPPPFDVDHKRDVVVFRREFGPVATNEGVELRLKFGVRVIISLDGGVLVENGDIRIAVSAKNFMSAIEHPNGRIYQQPDRVDIVAYDGLGKNNFIRYAKIWKDCISFTSEGCALIYMVDTAGTRTTSDQVNRDWMRDYCKQVFLEGMTYKNQMETNYAADHYRYKVEEDGTDVFTICNMRISQSRDGMIRVQSEPFSIRTSVENRSITLKTPLMHCTASMGNSPHLFIRINERRVHFDGTNFVVRNMGHSSSFDGTNYLRIH